MTTDLKTDLKAEWPRIVRHFEESIFTSRFYTFATVNPDGSAHATPIASLVLNDDCSGYFSDVFQGKMQQNIKSDQRVCVLAVRMGLWFWLKALIRGRYEDWPGIRLYGSMGEQRKARPGEIDRWRRRVNKFKGLKGYTLLWKHVDRVRDIRFTHCEPIRMGAMTGHLFPADGDSGADLGLENGHPT